MCILPNYKGKKSVYTDKISMSGRSGEGLLALISSPTSPIAYMDTSDKVMLNTHYEYRVGDRF